MEGGATLSKLSKLKVLRDEQIGDCKRCRLHNTRTNIVFSRGSSTARIVIVGEAPGADEDASGRPFVGRSGKLLDAVLRDADIDEQVYICNVVKCRPPGNRYPKVDEVAQCENFMYEQLRIMKPKLIITLGRLSAHTLCGRKFVFGRFTTHVAAWGQSNLDDVPILTLWHPAYILRMPHLRSRYVKQFKTIYTKLKEE